MSQKLWTRYNAKPQAVRVVNVRSVPLPARNPSKWIQAKRGSSK